MKQLLLLCLLGLYSCGPTIVVPEYKPTGTTVPGQDLLGKTYNIFTGEYADNKSTITEILDFSKADSKTISYQNFDFLMPSILEYTNIANSKNKINVSESINHFSETYNVSTGLGVDAMVFSGSVNTDVFKSRNENAYNYYSKNYYIVENHKLSIKDAGNESRRERFVKNLKPYLINDFSIDVNDSNLIPANLFKSYGTHFLAEIILGAKIEQDIRIESESQENTSSIETTIEAKYKIVKGNFSIGNTENSKVKNTKFVATYNARGGDIAILGTDNTKERNFSPWAKSVKNNPVLVDFTPNSLVPIWEFADDESRRNELKSYFYNVLAKQYSKLPTVTNKPKPVREFKVSTPEAKITDAYMKGVKKGGGLISIDYDNTQIWLSTSNDFAKSSYSYWWFYQEDEVKKNKGNRKYHPSGNTSKSKYNDGVLDRFIIKDADIDEDGEFYVYVYVANDNSSGARGNNRVEFGRWKESDQPIRVKDVNDKKEIKVTFFEGDLEFTLQF